MNTSRKWEKFGEMLVVFWAAHPVCFVRSRRAFRSELEERAVGTANLTSGLVVLLQQLGFHNTYWKAFFSPCIV